MAAVRLRWSANICALPDGNEVSSACRAPYLRGCFADQKDAGEAGSKWIAAEPLSSEPFERIDPQNAKAFLECPAGQLAQQQPASLRA